MTEDEMLKQVPIELQLNLHKIGRSEVSRWFEKYDLVETIVPLVWWKEWINSLVRCLPRYELYILFKYDSKLEWVEK